MRNQATLGGTIVVGDRESEVLACLLALDAQIILTNSLGEKTIPLSIFLGNPSSFKGIITEVSILTQGTMAHERVCRTPHDRPIIAAVGRKDHSGKTFIAFCGIGKIPILLDKNDLASYNTIEDFRGNSEYRKSLAKILRERILSQWEKSNAN